MTSLAQLSRFMRRLSLIFSAVLVVAYLGFNLAVVYAPGWLSAPIMAGTIISRGIVMAILLIIGAIAATSLFVRLLNRHGDVLLEAIRKERRS